MGQLVREVGPPVKEVTANFMPAMQETFTGGGGMTYADIKDKFSSLLAGAEDALHKEGQRLADVTCKSFLNDANDAQLGEDVGDISGQIIFEIILLVLTEGLIEALKPLQGIAKMLDFVGEAIGAGIKWLGKIGGWVVDGVKGLWKFVENSGAGKRVVRALDDIGKILLRYADELLGLAGKKAGGEAAEIAAEQALKEFGPRAAKFLDNYGDDFTRFVTHYGPDASKLSDESIESFLKWKKGLSDETQLLFGQNPAMWRTYTSMDPRARNLLTLCASECVPKGATDEQAKRIIDLINKHGLADDDAALKQYLHAQGNNLDKALDDIADAKSVADLRTRMREADVSAAQARMKTGDANSPVRQLDETDEDYIARLKKLRDEINNDPTRSTADDLKRLEDIESRLKRAEDRLAASQTSLDPSRAEKTIPEGDLPTLKGGKKVSSNNPSNMTDAELKELLDFYEARKGKGNFDNNADLLKIEIEKRRAAREEIKQAKEAFERQAKKGAVSDEKIINDMLAGKQDHIWVDSKEQADRVFRTLDEMAEGGAVIKSVEAGPPKAGRPDLPFRGPEKHIGGEKGSRQIHYNVDFVYNGHTYRLHIYFPE